MSRAKPSGRLGVGWIGNTMWLLGAIWVSFSYWLSCKLIKLKPPILLYIRYTILEGRKAARAQWHLLGHSSCAHGRVFFKRLSFPPPLFGCLFRSFSIISSSHILTVGWLRDNLPSVHSSTWDYLNQSMTESSKTENETLFLLMGRSQVIPSAYHYNFNGW